MKGINNILKPLYDLWHKVMDKFSVKGDTVELNGKDIQVAFDTDSITSMTDEQLDSLKVGDVVRKITGNLRHCYVVSYKEEKHGICLSYFAAGYTETVSYDYVTEHWVYNSTDVVPIEAPHTDAEIKALAKAEVESASSGTIADALGLDSGGNLVKGQVSSGGKLYMHRISVTDSGIKYLINLVLSSNEEINTVTKLYNLFNSETFLNVIAVLTSDATKVYVCRGRLFMSSAYPIVPHIKFTGYQIGGSEISYEAVAGGSLADSIVEL